MTLLNISFLKSYKDKYDIQNFVETGCYLGEGIASAIECGFKEENIYSCDIVERFARGVSSIYPKATIICAESTIALSEIIKKPIGKTFFWLDAHFASNYGGKETLEDRMPILEELRIISQKKGIENDIVVCDDMRVIQDPENYVYNNDIHENFKVSNIRIKELVSTLNETHHVTLADNGDGLLIFTPKSLAIS